MLNLGLNSVPSGQNFQPEGSSVSGSAGMLCRLALEERCSCSQSIIFIINQDQKHRITLNTDSGVDLAC